MAYYFNYPGWWPTCDLIEYISLRKVAHALAAIQTRAAVMASAGPNREGLGLFGDDSELGTHAPLSEADLLKQKAAVRRPNP